MFCDVPDKVRLILGCVAEKQHSVKTLVVMEPVDSELVAQGLTCGIQILSLAHIEVREEERASADPGLRYLHSQRGL